MPAHEENESEFKKACKELKNKIDASILKHQLKCSHFQGSNVASAFESYYPQWGLYPNKPRTSIFWHRYNDGVIRGQCVNCGKIFSPETNIQEYIDWLNKPCGNTLSEAGYEAKLTNSEVNIINKTKSYNSPLLDIANENIDDIRKHGLRLLNVAEEILAATYTCIY